MPRIMSNANRPMAFAFAMIIKVPAPYRQTHWELSARMSLWIYNQLQAFKNRQGRHTMSCKAKIIKVPAPYRQTHRYRYRYYRYRY